MISKKNNKVGGVWLDDKYAGLCKDCKVVFSLTVRKHHCRYCGQIFCSTCTNQSIYLFQAQLCSKIPKGLFNNKSKSGSQRVCKPCFYNLKKM